MCSLINAECVPLNKDLLGKAVYIFNLFFLRSCFRCEETERPERFLSALAESDGWGGGHT